MAYRLCALLVIGGYAVMFGTYSLLNATPPSIVASLCAAVWFFFSWLAIYFGLAILVEKAIQKFDKY